MLIMYEAIKTSSPQYCFATPIWNVKVLITCKWWFFLLVIPLCWRCVNTWWLMDNSIFLEVGLQYLWGVFLSIVGFWDAHFGLKLCLNHFMEILDDLCSLKFWWCLPSSQVSYWKSEGFLFLFSFLNNKGNKIFREVKLGWPNILT